MIKLGAQLKLSQLVEKDMAGKIKGDFISCDGKFAAITKPYPGGINIIDLTSGEIVSQFETKTVCEEDVKWSPAENNLAYIEHSPETGIVLKVINLKGLHRRKQ